MKKTFLFFFVLFVHLSYSQLSNFNLQVTATNATCSGNGSLSFTVTNTTAGASFVYAVYLLPNTTNPISITSNASLTGLTAGTYQVVATQTLGANSNSQQQNSTILNQVENLSFTIAHQNVTCGNDGVLIANVVTGTGVSYELLTGPVTYPAQTSNVFSNLPVGNYSIRVYDACNNAVVNSFTLAQNYTPIVLSGFEDTVLNCNSIKLKMNSNILFSFIAFPLSCEFKIYPPNNATPLIFSQNITSNLNQDLEQIIPRFNGNHFFDFKIIDACGNLVQQNNNLINNDFSFSVLPLEGCAPKIKINTENVVLPYTVEFLVAPSGFNPLLLNPDFPGPYATEQTNLNVVQGNFSIKLTDACNNSHTVNFQISNFEVPVFAAASTSGCGGISISIDEIYEVTIANVTLVSAPTTYGGSLPADLSSLISSSGYNWSTTGFPPGNYTFNVLDSCGVLHVKNVTIGSGLPANMFVVNYPECQAVTGSVYVYYTSVSIANLKIISAPSTFPFPLPYTLSTVSNTAFVLTNAPVGSYTVQMTSTCGITQTNVFNVEAHINTSTSIEIEPFCSSFNLRFVHSGNGYLNTYGLQKYNEVTGNWEHPITGLQIINNQISSSNFYGINQNQWNINLNFLGKFRIIKAFRNFNLEICVKPIQEFEVLGQPKFLNYTIVNCGSGTSIIQLNAEGIGQLQYRITFKNNQPFLVNNGNNSVFSDLQPAIYVFQIEDSCGNILNQQIEITTTIPIQIAANICENQASSLSVDNYTFLHYEWWKADNPSAVLSTSNVLSFNPFLQANHSGVYFVRITHIGNPTSCLNTTLSYTISNQALPMAGSDNMVNLCGIQNAIDLNAYLSGTFDTNGNWEEVVTSNSIPNGIWNASAVSYGLYQFKYIVTGLCSSVDEAIITIQINEKPVLNTLPTFFSICKEQDLEINTGLTNPAYTYQWTGPNNFSSTNAVLQFASIQNSANGQYTLIVTNNNCVSDPYNFIIEVTSLPEFTISETCENNIKTLTAIPINGSFDGTINFNWVGPNGFTNTINPVSIPSGNTGEYTLTLEKNTCEIFKEITVSSTACEIPKGISPNGDGLNEFLDLSGFDVNTIKIYNRYGLEVYAKVGYLNEWYGQANNGNLLPDATYFYVLTLNSGEAKTGWVYLTR